MTGKTHAITNRIEPIRLNAEESLRMAEAILNPREPSARSIAAATHYLDSTDQNERFHLHGMMPAQEGGAFAKLSRRSTMRTIMARRGSKGSS